jgi:hypothetical protein
MGTLPTHTKKHAHTSTAPSRQDKCTTHECRWWKHVCLPSRPRCWLHATFANVEPENASNMGCHLGCQPAPTSMQPMSSLCVHIARESCRVGQALAGPPGSSGGLGPLLSGCHLSDKAVNTRKINLMPRCTVLLLPHSHAGPPLACCVCACKYCNPSSQRGDDEDPFFGLVWGVHGHRKKSLRSGSSRACSCVCA